MMSEMEKIPVLLLLFKRNLSAEKKFKIRSLEKVILVEIESSDSIKLNLAKMIDI